MRRIGLGTMVLGAPFTSLPPLSQGPPAGGGRGGRTGGAGQTVEKSRPLATDHYPITGGGANSLVRVTNELARR